MSDSCDPVDCSPPGSSVQGDSPGKNTGVGCHAVLLEIFPTQGSNPGLLHCRQILYHHITYKHQFKTVIKRSCMEMQFCRHVQIRTRNQSNYWQTSELLPSRDSTSSPPPAESFLTYPVFRISSAVITMPYMGLSLHYHRSFYLQSKLCLAKSPFLTCKSTLKVLQVWLKGQFKLCSEDIMSIQNFGLINNKPDKVNEWLYCYYADPSLFYSWQVNVLYLWNKPKLRSVNKRALVYSCN